jgi:hypothetical protein
MNKIKKDMAWKMLLGKTKSGDGILDRTKFLAKV